MTRPAPTSLAFVAALAFASPSLAEAPLAPPPDESAPTTAAASVPDDVAPAPAPDVAPPPPLDPVEVPPAFAAEDAGGFLWSFVKSMLMLGVVLALIYLVLHKGLGRLVMRTQMGRRMRVVERIALDQRRALYLVEVDGHEVLLAGSDGGVVAVDLPGQRHREPPATPAAPAVRFSTELGKTGRPPPQSGVGDDDGAGHSRVQRAHEHGATGVKSRESAEG